MVVEDRAAGALLQGGGRGRLGGADGMGVYQTRREKVGISMAAVDGDGGGSDAPLEPGRWGHSSRIWRRTLGLVWRRLATRSREVVEAGALAHGSGHGRGLRWRRHGCRRSRVG